MKLRDYMLMTAQIDVLLALNRRLILEGCKSSNDKPVCAASILNDSVKPFETCGGECLSCLCGLLDEDCALR